MDLEIPVKDDEDRQMTAEELDQLVQETIEGAVPVGSEPNTEVTRKAITGMLRRTLNQMVAEGILKKGTEEGDVEVHLFEDLPESDQERILAKYKVARKYHRDEIDPDFEKYLGEDKGWLISMETVVPETTERGIILTLDEEHGLGNWEREDLQEAIENHPDSYQVYSVSSPRCKVLASYSFQPVTPVHYCSVKVALKDGMLES
jgi:hypothetical protein